MHVHSRMHLPAVLHACMQLKEEEEAKARKDKEEDEARVRKEKEAAKKAEKKKARAAAAKTAPTGAAAEDTEEEDEKKGKGAAASTVDRAGEDEEGATAEQVGSCYEQAGVHAACVMALKLLLLDGSYAALSQCALRSLSALHAQSIKGIFVQTGCWVPTARPA